jgi:hypothetical protein
MQRIFPWCNTGMDCTNKVLLAQGVMAPLCPSLAWPLAKKGVFERASSKCMVSSQNKIGFSSASSSFFLLDLWNSFSLYCYNLRKTDKTEALIGLSKKFNLTQLKWKPLNYQYVSGLFLF